MPRNRKFALEEAEKMLPHVRRLTERAVLRYQAAKSGIRAYADLRERLRHGGPVPLARLRRLDTRNARNLERLEARMSRMEALGCRLRDPGRGIVDFPATSEAGAAGATLGYWCWELGETRIAHWRRESDGYRERRGLTG